MLGLKAERRRRRRREVVVDHHSSSCIHGGLRRVGSKPAKFWLPKDSSHGGADKEIEDDKNGVQS